MALETELPSKLAYGTIKRISFKTFSKIFAVNMYDGTISTQLESIYENKGIKEWFLGVFA